MIALNPAYPCSKEHFNWQVRQSGQTSVLVREIWPRENSFWSSRALYHPINSLQGLICKLYIGFNIDCKEESDWSHSWPSFQWTDEDQLRIIVLFCSADDSLVKIPLAHFYCLPKKSLFRLRGVKTSWLPERSRSGTKSRWWHPMTSFGSSCPGVASLLN